MGGNERGKGKEGIREAVKEIKKKKERKNGEITITRNGDESRRMLNAREKILRVVQLEN